MNHLGLFAKYWQPGRVKTRLAASIGSGAAAEIYYIFLTHLLSRLVNCGDVRTIGFAPEHHRQDFIDISCDGSWGTLAQNGNSLGERMEHFFRWSQAQCSSSETCKTVLIGSDTPHLCEDRIARAFQMLDKNEVVIGPSSDGGYYLIGMRTVDHDLFCDITWSTPQVMPQTLTKLVEQGVDFGLLPEMTDVDEIQDLKRLVRDLEANDAQGSLDLLRRIRSVAMETSDLE